MRACMQVAAYADHHVLVEKHMHEDRPVTTFRELREGSERVREVAAMMDLGEDVAGRLVVQAAQDVAHQRAAAATAAAAPASAAGVVSGGRGTAVEAGEAAPEQVGSKHGLDGVAGDGRGADRGEDGSGSAALQGFEHSALSSEPLRPA